MVECVDTSCKRLRVFPGPGILTQHTSSALPMSIAATLGMICSSSWDSANMAFIISSPNARLIAGRPPVGNTGETESSPRSWQEKQ
jgi:hypothetical protein